MSIHTTIDSPLGLVLIEGDGSAISRVSFVPEVRPGGDDEAFARARQQFAEYFAGERTEFDLELTSAGTPFQERVWAGVAAVPYGRTRTYGELAAEIGAPRDRIRAVGAAIGANPLLVVRPCHRIVGANGSLTGYAGGLERKHALLTLEGALQQVLV
ncbi:methylated-DNA--[protein]-cysteine S-methyltransferase [Nonomuraea sediminis]|uniref:methylated-DNA--[protein]-cysteine S-methyltransferase n=1 Tax=Nonomuraea sediminis TaxID=2835864 RepID=UPI001BDBC38C|nr:methylated-DNA--[protein]-cysteine S-methyltransferase [Nonomuraea sediminis]